MVLIVLEGSDASGKATQAKLLAEKLGAELVSFPDYESPTGKLIKAYLNEEFPATPQTVALLYAANRFEKKEFIESLLKEGKTVAADRYTPSNPAHQAARVPPEQRQEFIKWIESVEAVLPQPDCVVFLDAPVSESQKLLEKRGEGRDYHEKDAEYLEAVRQIYLQQAKEKDWIVVNCCGEKGFRSVQEISDEIVARLKENEII